MQRIIAPMPRRGLSGQPQMTQVSGSVSRHCTNRMPSRVESRIPQPLPLKLEHDLRSVSAGRAIAGRVEGGSLVSAV